MIMFWGTIAATLQLWFWMVRMGPAHASADGASCWDGRPWATGNFSCMDPEPYLLTGLGNSILRMNLDGKDQRRIISGVGRSILFDFHLGEGTVFWADIHAGLINRAGLNGTRRQKLLSSVKGITGLAVDWIKNTVLWSNAEKGTIQRVDTDGRNEKTVFRDLSQPSSVVVDPNERYIFWLSDGVTPSIQRSDTSGENKATLVKVADRLKVLAIDHRDKRLFWVQQGLRRHTALGSCNYDGNIINVFNQPLRSQPLRMTVFLDYVYLTDSKSKSITRVNKYIGGPGENVNSKQMPHPPADVKVVHPINQPVVESPTSFTPGCNLQTGDCVKVCSHHSDTGSCHCRGGFSLSKQGNYCEDINECALWNHGCSLGCENVPGSYFCTCPKGYLLLPDMKTCQEAKPCVENKTVCDHTCVHTAERDVCLCPEGSVLKADGHSCTGCLSADHGGCSHICVTLFPGRWVCECRPGYQLQPDGKQCAATGPPPYLLFANVVDIRKMTVDGKQSTEKLLEEPKGAIIAVDYDPVQNKVYFADKELKHIERASMDGGSREILFSTGLESPEGLAVDWINRKLYWTDRGLSSISRSSLNGLDREVFINKDIQKPRGIALHPQAQKVYWTDMGNRPAVERSGLSGEMREVVVSTGLVSPSGISLDHGSQRLFWCDLSSGLIESANLDGSDRRVLSENHVGHPFDVAVFENKLWVGDQEDQLLYRLDMRTGQTPERLHVKSIQPAALVVVHPLNKPETGDSESSLSSKTLNDKSTPLSISIVRSEDDRPLLFTEKMVSDQDDCYSLICGVNAQCTLEGGRAVCQCVTGFTADGQLCVDIDECRLDMHECDVNAECLNTVGKYQCRCRAGYTGTGFSCQEEYKSASTWLSTGSPLDVTSPWQHNISVQGCPSTYDSYCLYEGVCFYFPEIETYACNCVSGYMGERCQFSDLEWWELQQAEQEKKRNVAIAVCIVLLVTLLSIVACITYCYGSKTRFGTCLSEDDVGDMRMNEDSMTETTAAAPQIYVVLDTRPCGDERVLHVVGCPRRVCLSCSSKEGVSIATVQRDKHDLDPASCSVSRNVDILLDAEKTTDNLLTF